jgi:hypothetical protein
MSSFNNYKNNSNTNNTSGSQRPVYKTFCKVCQDSGKPESIYTNHNVRQSQDKNSPVTCPTLLAQECRNCYKFGHSAKYCSLKDSRQDDSIRPFQRPSERYQQQQQQKQVATTTKPSYQPPEKRQVPKNVFMIFEEEDEKDAKEEARKIIEDKSIALARTLAPAPNLKPAANVLSFARIIAAAPELNRKEEVKKAVVAAAKAVPYKPKILVTADGTKPKIDWAHPDTDSEGDEYEYEYDEDNY